MLIAFIYIVNLLRNILNNKYEFEKTTKLLDTK